ncbi:hypothetical protein BJ170DRAFT_573493 [Xylariales sp. AK1849]|nr:hypothetical protein BJ170DRAFT_573493 [Xylariales sp. AK1849]
MRYEDWDVLLFPHNDKIPMREFKTQCHAVHDNEFAFTQGSYGLPTMTCFMPGLPTGTPFNISLHCWKNPEVSQSTTSFSPEHVDLVKFEARVFVDGRMVASSSFEQTGTWPQVLSRSFAEFTKNGQLEQLKFPSFRSELLRQNYWSPADDLGRIKIVISEGFPRDSHTVPIERVNNIVAFSFQHAPIDILEGSAIAWPNPAMWRRGSFNPTMPVPTERPSDGVHAHVHSPRCRLGLGSTIPSSDMPGVNGAQTTSFLGSMPNTMAFLQRGPMTSTKTSTTKSTDPFNYTPSGSESISQIDWANFNPDLRSAGVRKSSNSNRSMLDCGQAGPHGLHQMGANHEMNFEGLYHDGHDTSRSTLQVPTNTPTVLPGINLTDEFFAHSTPSTANFPSELAASLTNSLLNQPMPIPSAATTTLPVGDVKFRKENLFADSGSNQNTPTITMDHLNMRKVSHTAFPTCSLDVSQRQSQGHTTCSRETSLTNSSPSSRTFSGIFSYRSGSGGDFGQSLTNVSPVHAFTHSNLDASTPIATGVVGEPRVGSGMGPDSDKGTKHSRHVTPASARAIDDEDGPRRSSPRVKIGFGEGMES